MAQVTVELRNLLKTDFKLFDFPYDFDDRSFAKELEQAVLDYYWSYEIGQETPDDFKRVFRRRWLSAISYYNKLHNTTLLEYNPLINYKMSEALDKLSKSNRTQKTTQEDESTSNVSETSNEEIDSTSSDSGEQTSTTINTRTDDLESTSITDEQTSDYPQQSIVGGDYLSGARQTDNSTTNTGTVKDNGTSDSSNESTSTGNSETNRSGQQETNTNHSGEGSLIGEDINNENYEKTIEGITGITYQDLIKKERENMIRISQMLIAELKPCFILVY